MKKEIKDIVILIVVSLVYACTFQFVSTKYFNVYNTYVIDRIFLITSIMIFVGLHFILGFKKIYDFIIKYRYLIALALIIIFSLLRYSTFSFDFINRLLLEGNSMYNDIYYSKSGMELAFWWNFKMISLLLVTFEFCMLVTKNKYTSFIGSVVISFSGVVQWWLITEILFFGQLFIVLADKFMNVDKYELKIIIAAGATLSVVLYFSTLYISWMISFGYVFFALFIWVLLKNRKNYKITLKDLIIIVVCITIISIFFIKHVSSTSTLEIIRNTQYTGNTIESGGGFKYLFSYLFNFLMPYTDTGNNLLYASILSVFPLPLIFGLVYLYKKGKHAEFLLPLVIVTVVEIIVCISGLPGFLNKITLFRFVSASKCAVSVALANLYMLLYIISNIDEEVFKFKNTIRISLIVMCLPIFMGFPIAFAAKGYLYLFCCTLCLLSFLFLNYTDPKYKKVLLILFVILTVVGGITINPVTKATNKTPLTQLNWIL